MKVVRQTISYTHNGLSIVDWGALAVEEPGTPHIISQDGFIGNVIIIRCLKDGSQSTTKWDGKVKVGAGDIVILDHTTGELVIEKRSKRKRKSVKEKK